MYFVHNLFVVAGLLYEMDYIGLSRAFKYAVNKVNTKYDFNLIYDMLQVPPYDSFSTHRKGLLRHHLSILLLSNVLWHKASK